LRLGDLVPAFRGDRWGKGKEESGTKLLYSYRG
jgi:hypothetical protein